jgi:hypothetical protein
MTADADLLEQYSTPGACANGTNVLANAVLRLADQP